MTSQPVRAIDTSVAVPLVVASHHEHASVSSWARGQKLALSGHALIETYAVLTRLPGDARVSTADAVTLIDERFEPPLQLTSRELRKAHRRLAERGIAGAAAYDGLVALAAHEHGAVLVTRDARARSTYEALGVAFELLATG